MLKSSKHAVNQNMAPHTRVASKFHVYVSNCAGRSISIFEAGATSTLTLIEVHDLPGIGLPISVSPKGDQLFVPSFTPDGDVERHQVSSFERDISSGTLTPIGITPTIGRLTHSSIDQSGHFLLGASYFEDCIVVHPVCSNGTLGAVSFRMATGRNAHHIQTTSDNRFAFVPNLGSDQVLQLLFDPMSGTFAANPAGAITQQKGAGCRHVAHDPNGKWIFLVNERDGSIVSFSFNAVTGTLNEVDRDTILQTPITDPWAAHILVSPDGKHLYASERRTHVLARWNIDSVTGMLSDRVIVNVGRNPRGFDIDPSGSLLILGALEDNCLEIYRIGIDESPPELIDKISTQEEPGWIRIQPAE